MKSILSHTKRMLVMAICLCATWQVNAITIKVMKGGTAPHLYAWTGTAPNETKLTGNWPGTQFTTKDDNGYWTMDIPNQTTVNLILNMGDGQPQTADYLNISGVDGVASFIYDGGTTMYGTLPSNITFLSSDIYFVNPPTWSTPSAIARTTGGGYEKKSMESFATDGSGLTIYKTSFSHWNDTPNTIEFTDDNNPSTGQLSYVAGGYYNTSKAVTTFTDIDNDNAFTDANFKAAVKAASGGGAVPYSSITRLDVSNKEITSLAGINKFPNLIEFYAANNNINSNTSFTSNTNLEVLDLSNNGTFTGVTSGHTPYADISACSQLRYLDMSGNKFYYSASLASNTNLETLKLNNNSTYDNWGTVVTNALTKLKHVELSNCKINSNLTLPASVTYLDVSNNASSLTSINLAGKTNLKYLDLSNNTELTVSGLTLPATLDSLETLKLNNCYKLSVSSSSHISLAKATALKHLEFADVDLYVDAIMGTLPSSAKSTLEYIDFSNDQISQPSVFDGYTALKTFIVSGNSSMKQLLINNAPALETVDVTGNSALGTASVGTSEYRNIRLSNCGFTNSNHPTVTGLSSIPNAILNLEGNAFTSIPIETNFVTKYVKLRNNGITGSFTQSDLGIIEGLDLTDNTGITTITLNNTNLTALMLGNLSSLTNLNISGNRGLKATAGNNTDVNLTSGAGRVYITGCTALETLDISNCDIRNATTYNNFDVSSCTALKTINASGNTGTNMTYFQASDMPNGLEKLNLSGCTNLVLNDQITNLSGVKTSLKVLDVSNTGIETAGIPTFDGFTSLTTLNISDNPNMTHGVVVNNSQNLTSVNVTGNTLMPSLTLTNCGLSNSNSMPVTGLNTCTNLAYIDLSNNSYTSVPAIGAPESCTSLYLNDNALSNIDMSNADASIKFLYAEHNSGFSGGDYELTAEAAGSLKGLDLGNNGFTSFKAEGTALSALMIGDNTSLTTLELHGNNNLTCTTAGTTMSEGSGLYLLGNTNLESINIENSKFNNIGANNSLLGLSKVKTLRASHNEFKTFTNSNYSHEDSRDHTLSNIAGKPSLEDLTGLEYLDLSYNLIKDSVHLYRNTELKRLDVSHNQILGPLPTTEAERTAMIDKKLKAALKYGKTYNGGAVGKSVELTDAIRTALTKEDPYRNETRYADFRPCDLRDTTGIFHLDLTYNTKLEYIDISYTNIHNTAAGREYMNPGWETNDGEDSWDSWVTTPVPNQNYGTVKHHFIWMQPAGSNLRVFKCDHNNMQSLGTAYYANLDTLSATHMYGDCAFMADYKGIGWGSKSFNSPNCHNARYIDFSYGSYYSFNPTNLANVEKLIVTGNPIGGGHYPDYVLDVTHNSKLQQLQADECGSLQTIEAHHLDDLSTLDVTNDAFLKTLRAYNDPVLYKVQTEDFITGLASCTALEELWVSEDNLRTLNIDANTNLLTLKCYDNFKLPELVLIYNKKLSYLDFHNCKLNEIDLSENKALTYIDCSSPRVAEYLAEDGINKLSDLDIYSDNIQTVIANNNNLYRMTGLNKPSLTSLKFAHNHINGIDLSQTSLTPDSLVDNDNGRTIAADYTIVKVNDDANSLYDLYYFQLDSLVSNGGVFLGSKTSQDPLKDNAYRENLNYEGMVSSQITAWTLNAKLLNTNSKNSPIDLGDVENLIDPDRVIGTIVVLDEGKKHAEYTYDTGVSGHISTYYLDWDAPSVITAVTEIETDNKPTVIGGTGVITIQAPEGTAIMVYDMAGRLVQQTTAGGGDVVIDGMSPGVYIVNGEKVIVK